jgi:cobalamin biosynthesis protein CobT
MVTIGTNLIHNLDGKTLDYSDRNESLNVSWKPELNSLYTMIIRDETIDYLHLLVVNIPGTNIKSGDTIMDYQPPNPPSGTHEYTVSIYRQDKRLKFRRKVTRSRPNLDFTNSFGLIGQASFYVRSLDESHSDEDHSDEDDSDGQNLDESHYDESHSDESHSDESHSDESHSDEDHSDGKKSSRSRSPRKKQTDQDKKNYFKKGSDLNGDEEKFCRCILHVEEKGGAYNPYAVCAKSVGTTSRKCGENYNYRSIPLDELRAYLKSKGIRVSKNATRSEMLEKIKKWKAKEGK